MTCTDIAINNCYIIGSYTLTVLRKVHTLIKQMIGSIYSDLDILNLFYIHEKCERNCRQSFSRVQWNITNKSESCMKNPVHLPRVSASNLNNIN